ncbi:LOB domain-containing protein [Trifolium repens]|nr:LOB domain-containing protein [Trifolium repens]KAK2420292.1 LOB domain-containing protein [Trifolium repens]
MILQIKFSLLYGNHVHLTWLTRINGFEPKPKLQTNLITHTILGLTTYLSFRLRFIMKKNRSFHRNPTLTIFARLAKQ